MRKGCAIRTTVASFLLLKITFLNQFIEPLFDTIKEISISERIGTRYQAQRSLRSRLLPVVHTHCTGGWRFDFAAKLCTYKAKSLNNFFWCLKGRIDSESFKLKKCLVLPISGDGDWKLRMQNFTFDFLDSKKEIGRRDAAKELGVHVQFFVKWWREIFQQCQCFGWNYRWNFKWNIELCSETVCVLYTMSWSRLQNFEYASNFFSLCFGIPGHGKNTGNISCKTM